MVLEQVDLSGEDSDLLIDLIAMQLRERCGLPVDRQDEWALELAVRQGAAHVTAAAAGQTVRMAAGPATASLGGPGSFAVGHDPAAHTAGFRTDASSLALAPQSGPAFALPPFSRVEVTAAGPGPITPLERLYLPLQTR